MFRRHFSGNGRSATVREGLNNTYHVYAYEDSRRHCVAEDTYPSKAKAIRVAKDWIEYGA